ncbi:protein-glutamate O-methyltransferase [Phenylobacterium sp.]|uniref:CheR family methyltransferase n=1 Tax=Phenylobacterium sp. TaxID=1871053 RepID=UPI002C3B7112|nr:protein-glutamate O-methyltransferase [Phenylobacterium sp.]HLZ73803.1 protein-glutamate O-methyltransferase [Phenylobacterium sp.]
MSPQAALKRREPAMVEGEFVFTEGDFRKIAAMVHGDAGIALHETKATLVYSRLAKRLRALGLASFQDYCALVAGKDGLDERQKMLAALTTNVTRFFREPHHFDHLRDKVLPPLLSAARAGGKIRIWSAACSSGQEPYSAAMTILAAAPDAPSLDIKILATDIDPNMVAEARQGIYTPSLLAGIPDDLRRRWTAPSAHRPGSVQIAEEARALITFNELNLIGDWPMKGKFDAIFCRNVAIYFDDDTQARLWSRFAPLLKVGGHLYIGHSERVAGPAASAFEPDGITTYRLTREMVR